MIPLGSPSPSPPKPSAWRRRRLWLALGGGVIALTLLALFLPDRRSAWEQAALTRGRRPPDDPVTLSLWANELGVLLRKSEALGPPPRGREPLLRWVAAQCAITQQLQAVQRRHGKRVESPAEMDRPPYCEDLSRLREAFAVAPRP